MPHFFLEGFENEWTLVRETPYSQVFRVTTSDGKKLAVDIHFTNSKIVTASLVVVGTKDDISKSWLTSVMDEIARLALTRDDYAVIDYTMSATSGIFDGNYSIDSNDRKARKL